MINRCCSCNIPCLTFGGEVATVMDHIRKPLLCSARPGDFYWFLLSLLAFSFLSGLLLHSFCYKFFTLEMIFFTFINFHVSLRSSFFGVFLTFHSFCALILNSFLVVFVFTLWSAHRTAAFKSSWVNSNFYAVPSHGLCYWFS